MIHSRKPRLILSGRDPESVKRKIQWRIVPIELSSLAPFIARSIHKHDSLLLTDDRTRKWRHNRRALAYMDPSRLLYEVMGCRFCTAGANIQLLMLVTVTSAVGTTAVDIRHHHDLYTASVHTQAKTKTLSVTQGRKRGPLADRCKLALQLQPTEGRNRK